jgi:hypothetical protein
MSIGLSFDMESAHSDFMVSSIEAALPYILVAIVLAYAVTHIFY